jgi:hypothetical protein
MKRNIPVNEKKGMTQFLIILGLIITGIVTIVFLKMSLLNFWEERTNTMTAAVAILVALGGTCMAAGGGLILYIFDKAKREEKAGIATELASDGERYGGLIFAFCMGGLGCFFLIMGIVGCIVIYFNPKVFWKESRGGRSESGSVIDDFRDRDVWSWNLPVVLG